jgi:glycosyltransferase involved in cell wall biosynthesis
MEKNKQPEVSVLLTSYNQERYVQDAIDSVLNQTYSDFELILWDDGSTDDSWEIIESYTDARIRTYKNERSKRGYPIRRAVEELKLPRGKYIAIHHSDDIWEPEKLEKQVTFLDSHPEVGAVFTWAKIIDENGQAFKDENHFYYKIFEQPNRNRYEWLNYFFYQGNALCHPSVLIRKECYNKGVLYRFGMAQLPDFDMWVRLALRSEIYVLPEKLVQFRVHASEKNSSGDRADSRIRAQFEYLQILDNYRKISSFDELVKIFPEAEAYRRRGQEDIDFVLGMIAAKTGSFAFTRLFGLTLLFGIINDVSKAKKINEIYGFKPFDLINLTGDEDIFSIEKLREFQIKLADIQTQLAERETQLAERDAQLVERETQLVERDTQLHKIKTSKAWKVAVVLLAVRARLFPPNSLRAKIAGKILAVVLLPRRIYGKYKLGKKLTLLQKSGFFDEGWYLAQNPDVAQAGGVPLEHYLIFGGKEGRDPSRNFSSKWYSDTYLGNEDEKTNPLWHYLTIGRTLGYLPKMPSGDEALMYRMQEGNAMYQHKFNFYIKRTVSILREEGLVPALKAIYLKLTGNRNRQVLPYTTKDDEMILPVVSIIIPVYNALHMTQACLASVYRETKDVAFEVVLIDNASEDNTPVWLDDAKKKYPNLTVYRMDKNIGFGPAVNIGFQRSKGEYVVILNNDTLVSSGWLNKLLEVMDKDNSIGIISPVTNYVGEGPQIDEGAKELTPDEELINQYAQQIAERKDVLYEANRLVFFCVLLRRELIDTIGGLDEGYEKGNFEDDDYCLRTRMLGYQLAIAKNAFVYHHGTVTFKVNKISHSGWMEINRRRFYRKAGRIATSLHLWLSPTVEKDIAVSVIVRTKDRPELLKRALTSLANQTRRNFEVIVVNDGGDDVSSTVKVFEQYYSIKYIHHKKSKGRTVAINVGLNNAQGTWVAYLDDDDIVYPWHIEALLHGAQVSDAKVIYSDSNRALFKTTSLYPIQLMGTPVWEYKHQDLLIQNHIPIHSYIHLRECVNEVGFWNEKLDRLEDYEFLLRLSASSDFYHVRKVTCEYRFYVDSETSISRGRQEYLDALQHIYAMYPVNDERLYKKRQEVIMLLHSQVRKIEALLKRAGDTEEERMSAQREIVRLATGM